MIEDTIKLKLPLPPSVNTLFANAKKGRKKTEEYKTFEDAVWYEFKKMDRSYKITWDKWLEVKYDIYLPIYTKDGSKRKLDTFNFEKALSDVLQKHIEWFQDHKIKGWSMRKHDSENRYVRVTIKEM